MFEFSSRIAWRVIIMDEAFLLPQGTRLKPEKPGEVP